MAKEMKSHLKAFSLRKHNHVIVKFAVSFLLLCLAFRLLPSDSSGFSSGVNTTAATPTAPLNNTTPLPSVSTNFHHANQTQFTLNEKRCDIFTGDWMADSYGPAYSNESCYSIEGHQNCMRNGRPDTGYLFWKWKPKDCELARFDPVRFLHLMRNKSWAFIGDSISRNHVQSLLCILSQVEEGIEVYHDNEYRSRKWHFPSHNFTLSVIWTPFLIKSQTSEDNNGVSTGEIKVHLDELDTTWTEQYETFDYAVIAGGKWFLKTAIYYENSTIIGCHYCPGRNMTELGYDNAYRKALQLVFNFIASSEHKPFIMFRTTTPDHFETGEWFSGGTCNRTVPFRQGEIEMANVDATMHDIEFNEFENARALGHGNGVVLKLLDTTYLSLLRPDGHPGPYRIFQPGGGGKNAQVQNDCLHWCLPGPIDYWNDLVMEMLLSEP